MRRLVLALALMLSGSAHASPPEVCAGALRPVTSDTYTALGLTDAQIETAFDDCQTGQAAAVTGCEIVLPSGTGSGIAIAELNPTRFPEGNLLIRGQADGTTILTATVPQLAWIFELDSGMDTVEIRNITFDGRKDEQTDVTNGNTAEAIRINDATNVCIHSNLFHDFAGIAIESRTATKVIVEHNRMEDGGCHGTAAVGLECPAVNILTNGLEGSTGYCDVPGGTVCTIAAAGTTQGDCGVGELCLGGRLQGVGAPFQGGAVQFTSGTTQSAIRYNNVKNHAKSGIHCVGSCSQVWIEGNTVEGLTGNGIITNDFSVAGGQQDVIIRDNYVFNGGSPYYGVGDYGKCMVVQTVDVLTDNIQLIDNTTVNCDRHIKATGPTTNLVISGHRGSGGCVHQLQAQSAFILDGVASATLDNNSIQAGLCDSALELRNIATSAVVTGVSSYLGGTDAAIEVSGTSTGITIGETGLLNDFPLAGDAPICLDIGTNVNVITVEPVRDKDCANTCNDGGAAALTDNWGEC